MGMLGILDKDRQSREDDHQDDDRAGVVEQRNDSLGQDRLQVQPDLKASPDHEADRSVDQDDLPRAPGFVVDAVDHEAEQAAASDPQHRVEELVRVFGHDDHHAGDDCQEAHAREAHGELGHAAGNGTREIHQLTSSAVREMRGSTRTKAHLNYCFKRVMSIKQ